MTNPALAKIEEVYEMGLNPNEDYAAQLEVLAASGELSNKNSTNKVLFALCQIVDALEKRVHYFEEASRQIPPPNVPVSTQPLDATTTNRPEPDPNTNL